MSAKRGQPDIQQFQCGSWMITSVKSHILKSEGPERARFESELKLPQWPEMIFGDNMLKLEHSKGFGLKFDALEALKRVDAEHDLMKVAVADAWKEARSDCEHINDVIKPFDWTFTTDYKGTFLGGEQNQLQVSDTEDRIDYEKLKVRDRILFYTDTLLFEDELADNGCSLLNVKIRVMPACLFILLRFYLRVDGVLVRIHDTRFYHEGDKDFIIREYTTKESKVTDLQVDTRGRLPVVSPIVDTPLGFKDVNWSMEIKVPSHILTDPNVVGEHLKVTYQKVEKLSYPVTEQSSGR